MSQGSVAKLSRYGVQWRYRDPEFSRAGTMASAKSESIRGI